MQLLTNNSPVNQVLPKSTLKPSYGFVSTRDLISRFQAKGWQVDKVQVNKVRDATREGYQKHMVTLVHPNLTSIPGLSTSNSARPQLVLLNSHDGSSSLRVMLGLIRFACLNGIISGTSLGDFRGVHSKNIMVRLDEGIDALTANIPKLVDQVTLLASKQFDALKLKEFLTNSVDARLKNVNNIRDVDYLKALDIVRPEDSGIDAFTLFNRIQEKVIRGGIPYSYTRVKRDLDGTIISTTLVNAVTRPLRSIASTVELNRYMYDNALKLVS